MPEKFRRATRRSNPRPFAHHSSPSSAASEIDGFAAACLFLTSFFSLAYVKGRFWLELTQRGLTFAQCPSTSVPLRFESILYPESYCRLVPPQIHFGFAQEDCLDGF